MRFISLTFFQIKAVSHYPRVSLRRKILLPRPKSSSQDRPLTVYIYYAPPQEQLTRCTDLILDFPGGGFVAMTPEHHEERLRLWAVRTGRPVLAVDYGKAPEYPYPFAIDECFDVYRILVESCGAAIGMSGKKLNVIFSGDSAGATIAVSVMIRILSYNANLPPSAQRLPNPLALVLNYAALDFNFTSWMSPANLRVLRSEQSSGNLPGLRGLAQQKDHMQHVSPLSMVGDHRRSKGSGSKRHLKRRSSWRDTLLDFTNNTADVEPTGHPPLRQHYSSASVKRKSSLRSFTGRRNRAQTQPSKGEDKGFWADSESEDDEDFKHLKEEDRPLQARVRYVHADVTGKQDDPLHATPSSLEKQQEELSAAVAEADSKTLWATGAKEKGKGKEREPIGTRLTMASRTGYFQDRIISPSMMRAMAILYIGPHRNPDFTTDYFISPILAPAHLLAQFPPLLMQCGEKDPFVDDTVIFAGKVREAKRARKVELDLALAGKSARFGESLRMSSANAEHAHPGTKNSEVADLVAMKVERDKLARETEDDWVQMVLFSDWSHGYLQMPALMSEAKAVIDDLADWMEEAFVLHAENAMNDRLDAVNVPMDTIGGKKRVEGRRHSPPSQSQSPRRGVNGEIGQPSPQRPTSDPSPFTSETETDDSVITFVPKKRPSVTMREHEGNGIGVPATPPTPNTSRPPSDDTLRERSDGSHSGGSVATLVHDMDGVPDKVPEGGKRFESPTRAEADESADNVARRGTSTPRGGSSAKVGQRITESELMRRRRLLDSHIFD
ncbi:hypothetical protein SERLA73DRAFT_179807 [Serpula lacrymans var. lacrymans S7.3]|uniref:Alpha/beta hydrolase fold-3 domain-containing protein n=2 Tax=Serpula lacrymans var. lacrymans TaxID=341189 RepID=F8PUF3_SERL3|nr:uncharacterized protein SERLADRAFT_465081 [Serpula lacrymans var. lacrymans S7.9]EGN99673.1 hypothetical protein SERLA73DRAFT_179807 [Serpula lacrymans var. lacrymans S7.3]EGO25235.1 hypothetical protein SERLADRAFT_465081 [Serpula lacrymans var. lacrymans S7.9]